MKHAHLLKHHHLKATPQRLAIIESMEKAGHITIEELYRLIREKFDSISLATLYKNIHAMLENKLIREVKMAGHKTKYEIDKGSHAHIVCKGCGELKDIPFNPSVLLNGEVDLEGYTADDVSLVISGECPGCRGKERG